MNFKKKFNYKPLLYGILDVLVTFVITLIPFIFKNGFKIPELYPGLIVAGSFSVFIVLVFLNFRVYKMISREAGIYESVKLFILTFSSEIILLLVVVLVPNVVNFTDYIFGWILSAIALSFSLPALRLLERFIILRKNGYFKRRGIKTLIVGAGAASKIVIDESRRNKDNNMNIVCLVDDDPNKIGSSVGGINIEGPINDIQDIIKKYEAEEVIIAIASLNKEGIHRIISCIGDSNVRIKRFPLLSEMQGPNDRKVVDVDLDELLCRDPISLDNSEVNDMLENKTVLVTGAGGSIGSELVRQIYKTNPKTLVLFDIYENSTYDIQMELKRLQSKDNSKVNIITLIGSTYNEVRVEQIISKYKPDYIYHAAAYKHVPLMEDSPMEAIRTNVIGTYNVAKMAVKYNVKKMVLVSTDKAVRPTNVMGATKRFAETIIQYFSSKSNNTAFAAVRFGNVLGSNGSVVPLFKKQIQDGGPITITDKEIIRYFMTIPEAVSLILQCGLFAKGGEIFILDMGKPVKIIELAEKLIRQAGLVPYKDIDIVETGLRPGEKLFEELLINKETQNKTANEKIFVEQIDKDIKPIEQEIVDISKAFNLDNNNDIKKLLKSIIETYSIDER